MYGSEPPFLPHSSYVQRSWKRTSTECLPIIYPYFPPLIYLHKSHLRTREGTVKMSMFPDPRRIVTGHNEKGEAVVLKDSRVSCLPTPYSASFAVLWETTEFPASNQGDYDPITVRTTDLSNKNGIILRVVDIPPHTAKVRCNSYNCDVAKSLKAGHAVSSH
jgi:hypothetical protein